MVSFYTIYMITKHIQTICIDNHLLLRLLLLLMLKKI